MVSQGKTNHTSKGSTMVNFARLHERIPRYFFRLLVLSLGLVTIPALAQDTTAFVGVNVIPMTGDDLLEDQTVLIRGDRIAAIHSRGDAPPPVGARIIDAAGKFLIPGMADMHIHLPPRSYWRNWWVRAPKWVPCKTCYTSTSPKASPPSASCPDFPHCSPCATQSSAARSSAPG